MTDDFRPVTADQVKPVAGGADPFTPGSIAGNGCDSHSAQKVIGIIGAIVTGNLYLGNPEIGTAPCIRIAHDEKTGIRPQPYSPIVIFHHGISRLRKITKRSILIISTIAES
ncbi:hypothetical protein IMSAGC014_01972 [Bacteroidaceae bacterium]|nr:hypothetical protein IMSAGC014_01972 [Bacteroidaceae bacterium]